MNLNVRQVLPHFVWECSIFNFEYFCNLLSMTFFSVFFLINHVLLAWILEMNTIQEPFNQQRTNMKLRTKKEKKEKKSTTGNVKSYSHSSWRGRQVTLGLRLQLPDVFYGTNTFVKHI